MVKKISKKSKNETNVNVKSTKNFKSETPNSTAKRTSKSSTLNSTPNSTVKHNTKVNEWSTSQNVNTQPNTSENSANVSLTTYKAVSKNIYNDGRSYRVRVTINGETISVSTSTKKDAFKVRKQLFELREQRA